MGKEKYISIENGNESNVISTTATKKQKQKKQNKMSSLQHEVFPGNQSSKY